jgi:dihydroorotate dehydrogenase electron transfer subunit
LSKALIRDTMPAMRTGTGQIVEVVAGGAGEVNARVICPPELVPSPGKYILASYPGDETAVLATPLFQTAVFADGFLAAPPLPGGWIPGVSLYLSGPLGRGFDLPPRVPRMSLVALGGTVSRLMPLITQALAIGTDTALFTSAALPPLPPALEVYPPSELSENLAWADFMAFDLPITRLSTLRDTLGLLPHDRLPCPAQTLMFSPMPCGGVGDCGVCAVPARRSYKLACKDGPVFDLNDIRW